MSSINGFIEQLRQVTPIDKLGDISKFTGLVLEANGPAGMAVGDFCDILNASGQAFMLAQVIGFDEAKLFLMPFGQAGSIRQGFKIRARSKGMALPLSSDILGGVINAFGERIDGKMPVQTSETNTNPGAINPLSREAITKPFITGVACIDALLPVGLGQRVGIFAGSGVGKSMLLGMITRNMQADINVIALIGERGREVGEFITKNLQNQGLEKSIVVVATADEPALMRKQAVYTASAIARHFARQGNNVVLMIDSITRFAMAQREISLALGEPPTARGYTPSVFSSLPGIIEQAGNFKQQGSITAFYSVLVEGDDFNEPIADVMRSLLDGHFVLTRQLAHRGHFPAIDVLQSISRLSNQLTDPVEYRLIQRIRALMNLYEQSRDMIDVGAYQPGQNSKLDQAVERYEPINQLLQQSVDKPIVLEDIKNALVSIMEGVDDA